MRVSRWMVLGCATAIVGCAAASTHGDLLTPLGASLGPGAKTGTPIPLRFDPTAHVVIATVPNLPPASFGPMQAQRGEKVFDQTCATCHQPEKFIGKEFVDNWNDRRIGDFYTLVRGTMPVDNPGGLKDQEYIDVVAYLLKANHTTPTMDSLSADTSYIRNRKIAVHP